MAIYFSGEKDETREKYFLPREEWTTVGEVEAICGPICTLEMEVQHESQSTQSLYWIRCLHVRHLTFGKGVYSVVDIEKGEETVSLAGTRGWDAKTALKNLPRKSVCSAEKSSSNAGMKVLSPVGEKLCCRLKVELDRYLLEPTKPQLVSMA